MRTNTKTWVTGLALFSLFFGAGNLILPPLLGFKGGKAWPLILLGFTLSAVIVPILGIQAHARLQGTMFDFGKKVNKTFALGYCFLVYAISISLPAPRTASVTHEIALGPWTGVSPWITAILYFVLVYVFVVNRSKVLELIGKWLTPIIVLILFAIFGVALVDFGPLTQDPAMAAPFFDGVLEGYHTFDAIGSVVVGGVIIVSLQLDGNTDRDTNKKIIGRAGWIAGMGLLIIYAGLLYSGALMEGLFPADISRADLLNGLSEQTLGRTAQ
jgi:LIVCS family branched-chain amino acid:cation transporter